MNFAIRFLEQQIEGYKYKSCRKLQAFIDIHIRWQDYKF